MQHTTYNVTYFHREPTSRRHRDHVHEGMRELWGGHHSNHGDMGAVLPQVGEGCSGVQDTMYNHELAREREREGEGKRKYMW